MTLEEKIRLMAEKKEYCFEDLITIVEILRSEKGCPWDREQSHKSIRKDFIEETYEVIEAIDTENSELLREELGDVLLQVVFHANIEAEQKRFDINDVANDICVKLVHRHPHVFGDVQVDNSTEVLAVWNDIKNEEKQRITMTDKLRAIPPMLPALMRAEKVGKKAKCFDFADAESVRVKLDEELSEVDEAVAAGDPSHIEEEIGDLLLTITSLCRKLHVHPEEALKKATDKFIDRFETVEKYALSEGKSVEEMTMPELDAIWDEIKHQK